MESDPREAEVQFFRVTEDILGTLPMTVLVSAGIKSYHDTHEDPVRSVREKTIAHALQMHNQGIKRCHIFGVAGIRCLQTALEETLKAHGFDVSLEQMFGNLLDTKKNYAVSVIINFWFLRSIEMVNAALEEGHDVLRFGSKNDTRITFAAAKTNDELLVKDEEKTVFDFLSNVEDNGELLAKARSEQVRSDAREKIVRFSHHVGWILNRAFGEEAKRVFQQVCVCFMSAVAMLVMKHYEQEMKKLASPQ